MIMLFDKHGRLLGAVDPDVLPSRREHRYRFLFALRSRAERDRAAAYRAGEDMQTEAVQAMDLEFVEIRRGKNYHRLPSEWILVAPRGVPEHAWSSPGFSRLEFLFANVDDKTG